MPRNVTKQEMMNKHILLTTKNALEIRVMRLE